MWAHSVLLKLLPHIATGGRRDCIEQLKREEALTVLVGVALVGRIKITNKK